MLNVTTNKLGKMYSALVCNNDSFLSPELKQLGREADHSPSSCAEFTAWGYISSLPHDFFTDTRV